MALRPLLLLPARARAGQGRAASGRAWGREKGVGATHAPSLQSSSSRSSHARSARSWGLPAQTPARLPAHGPGPKPGSLRGEEAQGGGVGGGGGCCAAAELLLGAFCMKMAAPTASKAASLGCNNKPAFPELDFRSGARVEELNKLIQEFTKHDQREYDDQRALEIHTAKDFIFSMLGKEEKGGGVCVVGSGVENPFPLLDLFPSRFPSRAGAWGISHLRSASLFFLRGKPSCLPSPPYYTLRRVSLFPCSLALLLISPPPGAGRQVRRSR